MKKLLVMWFIVAFMMVGGLTFIGWQKTSINKDYYKLEKELEESAKTYFGMFPIKLPSKELAIKSETLINEDMLKGLKYEGEDCEGYVVVKKQSVAYKYTPFIKCSDYETNKYDDKKYEEATL